MAENRCIYSSWEVLLLVVVVVQERLRSFPSESGKATFTKRIFDIFHSKSNKKIFIRPRYFFFACLLARNRKGRPQSVLEKIAKTGWFGNAAGNALCKDSSVASHDATRRRDGGSSASAWEINYYALFGSAGCIWNPQKFRKGMADGNTYIPTPFSNSSTVAAVELAFRCRMLLLWEFFFRLISFRSHKR